MPTNKQIEKAVAEYFSITPRELHKGNRKPKFCEPRHIAITIMYWVNKQSLDSIRKFFGYKNHSSVSLATYRIGDLLLTEKKMREDLFYIIYKKLEMKYNPETEKLFKDNCKECIFQKHKIWNRVYCERSRKWITLESKMDGCIGKK